MENDGVAAIVPVTWIFSAALFSVMVFFAIINEIKMFKKYIKLESG
ncbi:UNVERIFIED_CONTAM: hypothetical protein ABID98_000502 [Brevibacillus sp. OAP136]